MLIDWLIDWLMIEHADRIVRQWTILVITQNNCEHKNLLGNNQWRAVVSMWSIVRNKFYFETSELDFGVPKSSIWNHSTSCDNSVFSFHYYQRPIEFKFSLVCHFVHMLRSEKTGLWQLPKVSSVFKLSTTGSLQNQHYSKRFTHGATANLNVQDA